MTTKKHKGWLAMAAVILAGCSGQYAGVPTAEMLSYQTTPTYGNTYAVATAYAESINAAVAADTLHPGMYADYGVVLAIMGHRGEACRMLNAEARAFPQSKAMVQRIKQSLLPEMMDDTTCSQREQVDMDKLAAWAYDSVGALQVLPRIASVIDSTDTARIKLQTPIDSVEYPIRLTANQKRDMLAQQQMADELRRKHVADSIAAAKQAKIDQRNQAQADRKKAQKEKEKARKANEKQKKKDAAQKRKAAKQQKKGGKK